MNPLAIRCRPRRALALPFLLAATFVVAAPAQATNPVCVYQGRSYSEGAFICVQKSLMQSCMMEGSRAIWRVVTEKEIGDRCVTPLVFSAPRKRLARRVNTAPHAESSPQPASAKCFVFGGKRYCE